MEIKNIERKENQTKKVTIGIRVTKKTSAWLKEQNYSPTGIFYEALKDLKCPTL